MEGKFLSTDPFVLFHQWYSSRLSPGNHAVSLATASATGRVSVRTVLLKGYDTEGFIFFTNYTSRKASDIESNPQAALLFYWPEEGRQIRIEGKVAKISARESDSYFATRPRESQIGAWASDQSKEIPSREYFEERFIEASKKFEGQDVPRPSHWGGFRIVPDRFEFWQESEFRLHHRVLHTLTETGTWSASLLAP